MSKKSCPILYSNLLYKIGQEFLDIQYTFFTISYFHNFGHSVVVVVYIVTIVAIGHGLLKKFWPLVLGCVLRTAEGSII